jgi:hypothetical protein
VKFFVLIYDRQERELLDLREFAETDQVAASAFRLAAQRRALNDNLDQEIVLFQAASREALERTHGSYFLSEKELLHRALSGVVSSGSSISATLTLIPPSGPTRKQSEGRLLDSNSG